MHAEMSGDVLKDISDSFTCVISDNNVKLSSTVHNLAYLIQVDQ